MTNTPSKQTTTRRPDCVTEVRMGNTGLTVFGCFKRDTADTAADKMAKVLKAESRCQQHPGLRLHAGTYARKLCRIDSHPCYSDYFSNASKDT